MVDDPELASHLVSSGRISPAAHRHARLLAATFDGLRGGAPPLRTCLVDLGYLAEDVLAHELARLTGHGVWEGASADSVVKQPESLRIPDVRVVGQDGHTLHYATLDPRSTEEAHALRLATGARKLVPWIATRERLWEAAQEPEAATAQPTAELASEAARVPERNAHEAHLDEEGPLVRLVNLLLMDTARNGVLRLRLGDGPVDARQGRRQRPMRFPKKLGPPIVLRLRYMAAMQDPDPAPRERGGIRISFGSGRPVDYQLHVSRTAQGTAVLVERRFQPLLDIEGIPQLTKLMSLADGAQSRGERERALREVIRAADGLGERGILTAIGRRIELISTLLQGERFGEVAKLGSEVRAMCEAHAPLAWDQFEGLLVPTLPRQERSAAFERIADRIRAHSSVLESAEVLEAALETIDPKDQPAAAERVAAALEACEVEGLGAPAFGTLDAWAKVAEGLAARGDSTADGLGENVLSLAAKLFPLAPNGVSSGSDPVLLNQRS